MSVTLAQCWDSTTFANAIMTKYNSLGSLVTTQVTSAESTAIESLIKIGLGAMINCETVYPDTTTGKLAIQFYIENNVFPLVTELRAQIFGLNNDMGKEHAQIKFNPVDNDNIESASAATDDLRFNYAQNMLTNVNFLITNTKALNILISQIKRDTLMVI